MSQNKRLSLGLITWVLIALMIVPVTGVSFAQDGDGAQLGNGCDDELEPGDEVFILEGKISFDGDDIIITVSGEGEEDGCSYVVAPAGAFNPSRVDEGDSVMLLGILLNEDTIRATDFFNFDAEDDDDTDDEDEDNDQDEDEDDEDDQDDDADQDEDVCKRDDHPVVEALANTFEVDYDELNDLRCEEHFGIGEIARAYLLANAADVDVAEIIEMRTDGEGWGNILKEYDVHPSELAPGRNRDKNKDKDDKDNNGRGRPEDGPPGQSDDHPGRGRGPKD